MMNNRTVVNVNDVISLKVENNQGKDLGKIEAIMLHKVSGKVAYLVLTYGGFLGMGNKLFALPWDVFTYDATRDCLMISLSEEKLKNSPGFDKANWPDMSDQAWSNSIHTYYGIANR
ncbi:MAG: PRC-barrel domain-containing protein [Legionellaceae bacterium]|nr:PRC-barrel domain-containing protein [Legionellaceae bacterium]